MNYGNIKSYDIADGTEITLGIQLCIHDVIIDKLHNRENCRNILLQDRKSVV